MSEYFKRSDALVDALRARFSDDGAALNYLSCQMADGYTYERVMQLCADASRARANQVELELGGAA
jgi:hypothetical protein